MPRKTREELMDEVGKFVDNIIRREIRESGRNEKKFAKLVKDRVFLSTQLTGPMNHLVDGIETAVERTSY